MRLNEKIHEIIKSEVTNQLGPDAVVRLFGSRVDDTQRGGDIDLLIELKLPLEHRIQAECKLAARLFIRLGGRKVSSLKISQLLENFFFKHIRNFGKRIFITITSRYSSCIT
jgi:predicted nucleotidyltransferase